MAGLFCFVWILCHLCYLLAIYLLSFTFLGKNVKPNKNEKVHAGNDSVCMCYPILFTENVYVPDVPEPTSRAELMKCMYRFSFSNF